MSATNCFIKLFFWTGDAIPCILRSSIKMERETGRLQKNGPGQQLVRAQLGFLLPHASSHSPWRSALAAQEVAPHARQFYQLALFIQSELVGIADQRLLLPCYHFPNPPSCCSWALNLRWVTCLSGWLFWWQAGLPQLAHSLRFLCKNSVIVHGFLH